MKNLENDIREGFAKSDLMQIIASSDSPLTVDEAVHELLRRPQEISIEMSSVDKDMEAAEADYKSALSAVNRSDNVTRHQEIAGFAIIGSLLLVMMAGVAGVSGWTLGLSILKAWRAPLWSGWPAALFWIACYTTLAVGAYEAEFLLRRRPRRRKVFEAEAGLEPARNRMKQAVEARSRRFVDVLRQFATEIVNTGSQPRHNTRITVAPTLSAGANPSEITIPTGLSEVAAAANEVPTAARKRLMKLFEALPGASIGISGSRGVGKSTLLSSVCGPNLELGGQRAMTVLTAAPVDYDGRDFLLHLFASLCRQVLTREQVDVRRFLALDPMEISRNWRTQSLRSSVRPLGQMFLRTSALLLLVAVTVSATSGLIKAQLMQGTQTSASSKITPERRSEVPTEKTATAQAESSGTTQSKQSAATAGIDAARGPVSAPAQPLRQQEPGTIDPSLFDLGLQPGPFATIGLIFGILGVAIRTGSSGRGIRFLGVNVFADSSPSFSPAIGDNPHLVERTVEEYRNIRFQRSYTAGWSGAMKAPAGVELGSSAGLNISHQAESLPELVERFRSFVAEVASTYGHVVIGIDELDKLKSTEDAEALLNSLKSVFGINNCFYLISVSENALNTFERRGLGFRDAFDSALDDVLQVEFLDLPLARALLARRVLRLPDPFVQLCHMLSGGLPRDLIRAARLMMETAASRPGGRLSLKIAAQEMMVKEINAKVRATSVAIRSGPEVFETSDVLVDVEEFGRAKYSSSLAAALRRFDDRMNSRGDLASSDGGRRLQTLCAELSIYLEMLILMRAVAGIMSTEQGWERANRLSLSSMVADLRRSIEVSVPLARARLGSLQQAVAEAGKQTQWTLDANRRVAYSG